MILSEIYLSQNDGTSLGSKQFLFLHHVYDFPNIPFHVVLINERVDQMRTSRIHNKVYLGPEQCITLNGSLSERNVMFGTSLNQ